MSPSDHSAPSTDARLEAIARAGRATRTRPPRWLWVLAGIVGLGCAVAFVVAMVHDGTVVDPSTTGAGDRPRGGGLGFGAGLAIGLAAGISIGFAIARLLGRERQAGDGDHSPRSSP